MYRRIVVVVNKLINATKYSLVGLRTAIAKEWALRVELLCCAVLFPGVFILAKNYMHGLMLLGTFFLVIIAELFNTAIERVVDRVGLQNHSLSKEAKDIGSSCVFLAIILSLIVWVYSVLMWLW